MVGLSKSHLQEERKTDCQPFILTVFFWALQVLWRWYQRRRWGCRPAGSLAQLSPGEVELSVLLSNSVHCVAEAGWCQLDQFERSKFRIVPRFANLVAMFGQFVRRCVFFWMLRQLSRLFLWQHLATLKGHKCEIDSCKGSDMQESLARGAATNCIKLPSFYPHRPLLSTPGALIGTPKALMGPQTCWKSCGTPPWRSWTLRSALKLRPLRGRSCVVPAGPIWEKQTSHGALSCKLGCDVWPVR